MSPQTLLSRVYYALGYTIPAVVRPLLSHLLGFSQTSSVWDFRTALVVTIVRALFNDPLPVSMLEEQRSSIIEPEVAGPMWISKDEFPVPDDNNVKHVVMAAVRDLGGQIDSDMAKVVTRPVKGEWVAHRSGEEGIIFDSHRLSEEQKYTCLAEQAHSDVVFLFLHGGQF